MDKQQELETFAAEVTSAILGKFNLPQQNMVISMVTQRVVEERVHVIEQNKISMQDHQKALDDLFNNLDFNNKAKALR